MRVSKLSIGVLFLVSSSTVLFGQVKNDTVKKEQKIEGVILQGNTNRKSESAVLLDQKKAIIQKQSIGSEEISRKGISDVEEGLTKMTGITKVDGRGIFVRGLEDRYNNLLLNGLQVPSNNPFKKIISMEQFQTDIVAAIETYKTFNADIYGDFAGATFNIVLNNEIRPINKISFGVGYTTDNNLVDFLQSKGENGVKDYFGFTGDNREFPAILGSVPANQDIKTANAVSAFKSGFDTENVTSLLNSSFGYLHSSKLSSKINFILSLNYDNKYQVREGIDRFFNINQGNYDNNYFTSKNNFLTNQTLYSALNFKLGKTKLTGSVYYVNSTENSVTTQIGYSNSATNNTGLIRTNELMMSKFLNAQLNATHAITDDKRHQVKGGVSISKTRFELPDRKAFRGALLPNGDVAVSYAGNSIFRQFYDFDTNYQVSGLAEYSWNFGGEDLNSSHKLTVGYNGNIYDMDTTFRFLVSRASGAGSTFNLNNIDSVLYSDLMAGNFYYSEASQANYNTKFRQLINAGYADLAYRFGEKLLVNAGIRLQNNTKTIKYRDSGSFDDPFKVREINNLYILPALNVKYSYSDRGNIRLSASQTVTEPTIMESFPLEFVNMDGTVENGFVNIKNSENLNLDLKYELFPTNKELFAVTAFAKKITNPIEKMLVPSAGSGGQTITYINSKSALVYGLELESMLQLKRLSDALSNFSIGFNASFLKSEVDINPLLAQETHTERELQGASKWMGNADLKYEKKFSEDFSSTLSLVYNAYGKRIFAVGTGGIDHYYEMPFNKLDFIWGNKLSKNWDLKLAVENILNPTYKIQVGEDSKINIIENDLTIKTFKRGIGFTLTAGYTF